MKTIVLWILLLTPLLFQTVRAEELRTSIPDSLFDSIRIEIEYIYFNHNVTEKRQSPYGQTVINGWIANDDPTFWRTLNNNIRTIRTPELEDTLFKCGCPYLNLIVRFCNMSTSMTLMMNSCNFKNMTALLKYENKTYYIVFDKKFGDGFKKYVKLLLDIVIPRKITDCGLD